MKKQFFFAAMAIALASCASDDFVGENNNSPNPENGNTNAIVFTSGVNATTRSGEFIGAAAAEKLGGMFVVEGTKGTEQSNSPSTTVVFDNYLVGYTANTAGKTESNTNNWEYVNKQTGITDRMTGVGTENSTWESLHSASTDAKVQSIKYWDYSAAQYDFIAWSTGTLKAVTTTPVSGESVKVTRINTGSTLATDGFTLTAASADDLLQCYYTDITTVVNGDNYGKPVTLTFKNLGAKVRVALYETVPGYSVKNVYFYTSDANPTTPADLGYATTNTLKAATLFTMGSDVLPRAGAVTVCYPHIGTTNNSKDDYNKASVTVVPSGSLATQAFGELSDQYGDEDAYEAAGNYYLGRTLPEATFAGDKTKGFYTAVIPNPDGKALTLRVDYTLVSTDGSGEEIKVYGAKAVVPSTYTEWLPNYAYTYIFKISDNSNGWTSKTNTDPKGLFPITFDAVVASFTDANAEQTTVTTVATPSITTYQQGHNYKDQDEYSNSQTAGKSSEVKDLYVQVMDNSGATSSLVTTLSATNSLLFSVSKTTASEAEVMDALKNRTNSYSDASPVGRNGITLTTNANISNSVDEIVNGVDDNPIDLKGGGGTGSGYGKAAKIDIDQLTEGTYAYVYCKTVPTSEDAIYHVAAATSSNFTNYYKVAKPANNATPIASGTAAADHVYFVKNLKADGTFDSYTYKQTKEGDDVSGLVDGGEFPSNKATGDFDDTAFYFDVYNKNNGEYAVKVIKVVD